MKALGLLVLGLAVAVTSAACSDSAAPVTVRMSFARPDFFAAPFPRDDRLAADGHVDLSGYPNPSQNLMGRSCACPAERSVIATRTCSRLRH